MKDELLDQREAASRLGLGSPRTLEGWRLRGYGPPFVRLSPRLVRYRSRDLEAWVTARVVGAAVSHQLKDDGRSDSQKRCAK